MSAFLSHSRPLSACASTSMIGFGVTRLSVWCWVAEEAAYDEAMKDMQEQALRQGGDELPQGAN